MKMRIPFLVSLKYRIALIVFVLEVILLSFVLNETLNFIETRAHDDMLKRQKVFFELIKSVTQDSLFAGELEDLQTFIDKISKDKEITNIVAVNDAGTIVANNDFGQVGSSFLQEVDKLDEQWAYESIEGLGLILIRFSNQSLIEHTAAAQKLGMSIAITGISIITCVSLFFGFFLTRRLKRLTVAVNHFHQDNRVIDVDTSGQDEIAILGKSFNFMSSEINGYIVKLEKEQGQLEERVLQRTEDLHKVQEQLIRTNRELKILSTTDRLTALYNRAFLDDNLTREIIKTTRSKSPFGIILIDIDKFKLINDRFGHDVGDEVIVTVASSISNSVRSTDLAGRWGGEEFLVICPNTNFDGVFDIANRIHQAIRLCQSTQARRITGSLGITMFESGDSLADIIKRADIALYQAKSAGRNCVKVFNKLGEVVDAK